LIVPHARYLIDAAGIDPLWAATLSCSGLSSYAAVSKLRPIPVEEWIAVIGAGGLGLSAVGMLRAIGHQRIVAVDIDRDKLATAEKAGAAATLNTREGDPEQELKRITNHALFGAIDFVGAAERGQIDSRRSVRRGNSALDRRHNFACNHGTGLSSRQYRRTENGHRACARTQNQADPHREAGFF
jgi:D-arabinose 1-dehydrogenase-like Zn-dependent alcohol dehydrogenase